MPLSATTKLEAINTMLSVIGEAPVSSFEPNATGDVLIAGNILNETLKEVQSRGWYWNTEYKVSIPKDIEGKIFVAGNVSRLDVDPTASEAKYTIRDSYLYDLTNHTDIFTADVSVTAVYLLEWAQIPEVAKRYVTVRAGRIFQDRMVSSQLLNAFNLRDEMVALADLKNVEMEVADYSIFDNAGTFNTINRTAPINSIGRY